VKRLLNRLWCVLSVILMAQVALAQSAPPDGAGPGPGSGPLKPGGPPPGPPPLPQSPDLPVFGAGGGRVLFGVASEKDVMHHLMPPLPADAPKPSADPRNLEGPWAHDQPMIARVEWDAYGNDVPFRAAGRAVRDRRVKSSYVDKRPNSNASGECRPPGQPWLFGLYYPFQIDQTTNEIDILFAMDHAVWPIRLDQSHDPSGRRQYMGDSIGHWDGDTLVVDTTNFKRSLWIDVDGTPASKDARLEFRIRKISYPDPKLEIVTTVYDPKMYTAPWSFVRTFAWRPDKLILDEYNCELQAAQGGAGSYGLIPDPDDQQ
jgi:hypothetical protein